MSELLEEAFRNASVLPPDPQNSLAQRLLAGLASDFRWDEAFARSSDRLPSLAEEALAEHRRGATRELDPGALSSVEWIWFSIGSYTDSGALPDDL